VNALAEVGRSAYAAGHHALPPLANNKHMRFVRFVCAAVLAWVAHVTDCPAAPPLWFEGARPTAQAQQALQLLAQSATHGLDPRDYDAESLARAVAAAAAADLNAAAVAPLDRRLTAAMERYLADLHDGRLGPQALPRGYRPPKAETFDAAATLRSAVANNRVRQAAEGAAPQLRQYDRLREALAQYRTIEARAWATPLPALPPARDGPPRLERGQAWPGVAVLRERLIALGDLPRSTPPGIVYDGTLAAGVRAFQQRHGLATDGVIGRATFAQLQVTPARRARQIELMLERLRWTPLLKGPRMVAINIPEFTLRAYEVDDGQVAVRATMKIIVGKALNTRTPLFVETMRLVEFQPYWNVPRSIARNELVPRLRREPAHWDREGFEFVVGGRVEAALSTALLDEVVAGHARIRQRPGPRNALGDIKFVFPNDDNIYLHHTPSVQLFARDRRDFSHGCIRVEEPVALAEFVLRGLPGWNAERIRQAMSDGEPTTVRLAEPLPVLIAYGTAMVKDGRVHFYDDIYGHDRHLDAALRQPRPPLPGT
jgi:murein L,D-transpeptidase YcbB/YkuD